MSASANFGHTQPLAAVPPVAKSKMAKLGNVRPKVALAYKVYYAKTDPTRNAGIEVDHTSFIFLVGPDGKYLGFAPPGTTPARLADIIARTLTDSRIE